MEEREESNGQKVGLKTENLPSSESPNDNSPMTEQRLTIEATASGHDYEAEFDVSVFWNADGQKASCTFHRYKATKNDRNKGNFSVQLDVGNGKVWLSEHDDVGIQDGEWHSVNVSSPLLDVSLAYAQVTVYWRYDRDNTGDVTLNGHHLFYFAPQTPVITTPSGAVETSTFTVMGTEGVYGIGTITLHSADLVALPPSTATIQSNGSWQAQVTFPAGINTLQLIARQKIGDKVSDRSNLLSVSLVVSEVLLDSPKSGDVIDTDRPTVTGRGHTGATVNIYESEIESINYGSGVVTSGSFSIPLTTSLPHRAIDLIARQVFNGATKWSNIASIVVRPNAPTITQPAANSQVNRSFTISGTGGEAGARMAILIDLSTQEVGHLQSVTGDAWSVPVVLPASIPLGEVRLVALQTLNGVPSSRSPYRPFNLRPERVTSLAATVDDDAKVTITGTGTVGATLYIHYVGDDAPLKTFTVPSNPWSMDYPDWLPRVAPYIIGARQSVTGADGQPIYSEWADREGTFTVNVPLPTLTHRVSPDGIPTFEGTGKNWPGQPASTIEVRLNNTNTPIVPIEDVRPDHSWTSAAAARWAPGTYSVTARQSFQTLSSTWLQPPETVVISAPPAVIEKVTPNGLFAKVVGQCWPGAELTITFSDDPASHPVTDTDNDGQWDFQRSSAFRPGRHTVTVTQTFGGQTSSPVSMPFEIAVSVLVITPPPGGQTDHLPVLHGTGGIDGFSISVFDSVTHDLLGTAIATGDAWLLPLKELDYGSHTVFAVQELDDLKSQPSTPVTFDVVLFAPRIDFPETGTSVPRTFAVEGYARGGKEFDRTEVDVYLDGIAHRVYPNFGDGYFKQHFTRPLGPCVLKARQYFKDQESAFTQDVLVTIVPDKALIETPGAGEAVGHRAVICGFGYAEDEVVVALPDGTELGRALVQGDGTWFCQVELPETGTDLSLLTEQRKGEFHSGWSEPRTLLRLAAPPTFDEPPEGNWEGTTPGFAGGALAGSQVDVVAWYDCDEKHAEALATNGERWAGVSERDLPAGPQWARAVQVVGGKPSMPADSKRFEIAPSDDPSRRHPTPE